MPGDLISDAWLLAGMLNAAWRRSLLNSTHRKELPRVKKPNPKTEEEKILGAFWKFPEGSMSGNIIDKKGRQPTETLERRSRDGSY